MQRPFTSSLRLSSRLLKPSVHPSLLSRGYGSTSSRPKAWYNPSTIILCLVPVVTLTLGTWQVKRLRWKVDLIQDIEHKTAAPELTLPRRINPETLPEFQFRRVRTSGHFDHAHEMLLGPRGKDGTHGYYLVVPLIRAHHGAAPLLVNRGFIPLSKADPSTRPLSRTEGEAEVMGLLRSQEPKGAFTPENAPKKGQWLFEDLQQMADYVGQGCEPVLIDQVFSGTAGEANQMTSNGVPVGREPKVELRNMHLSYAVTWYTLSAATAVMLYTTLRKGRAGSRIAREAQMARSNDY